MVSLLCSTGYVRRISPRDNRAQSEQAVRDGEQWRREFAGSVHPCPQSRAAIFAKLKAVIPGMNAIAFTREVRVVFDAPRRMVFSAMLAAILRGAQVRAPQRMILFDFCRLGVCKSLI